MSSGLPEQALESELRRFVTVLQANLEDDLVTVCLFGSQVESAREGRDIDLLIVWDGAPERRWDRGGPIRKAARAAGSRLDAWLSPIVLNAQEAKRFKPYYLGILGSHRMLFDRAGFFASVLERLRRRLDELGARRLTDPDGYEYWDLAPDWRPGDEVVI